jgi:mycolipenoyl-CoA---2-(long-chain-fatty acyl)-trehalose mycolipenoyltransferase / long-chain-acyl-CoA---trehalose acyltransferase
MQTMSFNDFHPAPGRLVEWSVSPDTADLARAAPPDPVPTSYNQQLHLQSTRAAAAQGLPGNPWIGASFEIEGAADLDALEISFTTWLRRHEALRSGFREGPEGIERFTLSVGEVSLARSSGRDVACPKVLHDHLDELFLAGTNPFSWPPLVLGVISRPRGSTVFVAMDHVCGDGYSLALAVWELQEAYEAAVQDREAVLPEIGSYLEHCAEERERGEAIDPADPVVAHWRDFIRSCGGTTPTFPLNLGVEPGQIWPQSMFEGVVASADEADVFDEVCRQAGGSFFAGLLAAMGIAVREVTGQEEFRTVTPVHTRYKHRWRTSMGWFITCAPLEFSLAGAAGFTDVLPRANATARNAMRLSRYPAARVIELLGKDFTVTRRDLFSMVSYTDYRQMPGVERYAQWNPVTIGEVSVADDSHVWASRNHQGLHLGIRHPDTPTAEAVLTEYTATIAAVIRRVAATGDYPLAPAWACRPMPGHQVNA